MSLNFNTFPYYDDYTPDKNFYKILFKAGYAVQARELNQMQSILQHQISTFANHIFKKNSMVIPGGISLKTDAPLLYTSNVSLSSLVGKTISNAPLINGVYDLTNSTYFNDYITAVVLGYKEADDTYPACLYVKYFNSQRSENRSLFNLGDSIYTLETSPQSVVLIGDGVGSGKVASIAKGVFYTKELFVDVPAQSLIVEAANNVITNCNIGLNIVESIVDYTQDDSLLDNAQGYPNQYAPGADRYKVELILTKINYNAIVDDEKFINLMSIENDVITYLNVSAQYAELMKTLAKRTYDTNGNFIVGGLIPTVNKSNDDKYVWVSVGRGNCYLGGYEYSQIADFNVPITKPRDNDHTETIKGISTYCDEFPYFFIAGGNDTSASLSFISYSPTANELIQLINCIPSDTITNANVIGYCVFKSLEYFAGSITPPAAKSDAVYKMYIENITLHSGYTLKDIGGFTQLKGKIGAPILHQISIETPLYPLSYFVEEDNNSITTKIVYSSNKKFEDINDDCYERGALYYAENNKIYLAKLESIHTIPETDTLLLTHPALTSSLVTLTRKSSMVSNYSGEFYPIIKIDDINIKTLLSTDSNNLEKTSYSIIKEYNTQTNISGEFTISAIGTARFEDFSVNDYSLFVYENNSSQQTTPIVLTSNNFSFSPDFKSLTVTVPGATYANKSVKFFTTQIKSDALPVTYESQTGSITIPTPSASWMALNAANVQEIVKILDTGDINVAPGDLGDAEIDITSRYILDTMSTASGLYTSLIKLKKHVSPPSGQLLVSYKLNDIGNSGDFSSIDSYIVENDSNYTYIGKIKDIYTPSKQSIPIRNYLDFRTTYTNTLFKNYGYTKSNSDNKIYLKDLNLSGLTSDFNGTNLYVIGPGVEMGEKINTISYDPLTGDTILNINSLITSITKGTYLLGIPDTYKLSSSVAYDYPKSLAKFDYGYIKFKPKHIHLFVNRVDDKLSIAVKEINGPQDINQYRRDEYKLPLAYIYLAPYTANMSDISMQIFQNPVYKMLDIHEIKERVDRVEYYSSLSLNKDIHQDIIDASNENQTIANQGFWNEDFENAFSQDFEADDYKCTLYDKSHIGPGVVTRTINMERTNNELIGNYNLTGSIITLPYKTVRAFGSDPASTFNNLNPYNTINWSGKLSLNPSVDNWVDTVTLPVITKPVIIKDTPNPEPLPIVPPIVPPPVPIIPPPIVPPPPKPVEEIVTEVNVLRRQWGKDSKGGYHAITFTWKTNLARSGRVNSDMHLSPIIKTKGWDGTYALSLKGKKYNDADVKNYLNAGTHFDKKPPEKW